MVGSVSNTTLSCRYPSCWTLSSTSTSKGTRSAGSWPRRSPSLSRQRSLHARISPVSPSWGKGSTLQVPESRTIHAAHGE